MLRPDDASGSLRALVASGLPLRATSVHSRVRATFRRLSIRLGLPLATAQASSVTRAALNSWSERLLRRGMVSRAPSELERS